MQFIVGGDVLEYVEVFPELEAWCRPITAPKSAKHICQFLGLVHYISSFILTLAEHAPILTLLTCKKCNANFPVWTSEHQYTFESIKRLVVSHDCIGHESPGENKIWVTCDASKCRTGTILAFGPTWESTWPVAFKNWQLNGAEWNYPIHEQQMLAIARALKK